MRYLVRMMPRAERDLEAIYNYIHADSSSAGRRWFGGMIATVQSLEEDAERGLRSAENPRLRQLLYGNKPHVYRIIYTVNAAARRVDILHVRHGARQPLA